MEFLAKHIPKFFEKYLILIFFTGISITSCDREPMPGENEFRDSRDGWIYRTVQIGNQRWMAQNLAYLPQADTFDIESDSIGLYYIYDYAEPKLSIAKQTTNYFTYGVLYNWAAATEACPDGWHLPSDEEWKELEAFLGMNPTHVDLFGYRGYGEIGKQLKSKINWDENGNGTDNYGFDAKPGGRRAAISGLYRNQGERAFFWTSTPDSVNNAILRYMTGDSLGIYRSQSSRRNGVSVRCIMN